MHSKPRLSKSRFMDGTQCMKMLWWKVHEPDAPELAVVDASTQAIFDRGHQVGELARQHVPGGVLIDEPYYEIDARVASTAKALAAGAPVVYEASFLQDDVYVAVDIIERSGDGFVLSEVKSTLDVKEQHVTDAAVQLHVARRAGLPVTRAEIMHLNRDCTHPDLSNLFVRENVTKPAQTIMKAVPQTVKRQLEVLQGPLPDVAPGDHCSDPYDCPFIGRCWPALPEHHVSTLYKITPKKLRGLLQAGHQTLRELPEDFIAKGAAQRQIESIRTGAPVIEPGLKQALRSLRSEDERPIAFLDFETIMPAVPVWPGCHPYQQIPVQFSCHLPTQTGLTHHQWLADGPGDPREAFAQALITACQGAKTIVAYSASFEQRCLSIVGAGRAPPLQNALQDIHDRIHDLLPIIRDHVYHPGFNGCFSLKKVLPALVPDLDYGDLEVQDGSTASALLEGLLLRNTQSPTLRDQLLKYCERDTLAMVRLYQRLLEFAGH
jgi:hypothetical protein